MKNLINQENSELVIQKSKNEQYNIVAVSNSLLKETRENIKNSNSINIPIAGLSSLGGSIASMVPAFRTVMQTTTTNVDGLYRLANMAATDTLKAAKDGNFWGAFKTLGGKSKMLKIAEASPVTSTVNTVMPFNPATIMMSVALFSIEQQLKKITEIEKQIIGFLEDEKQSEIEADLITLNKIIQEYKYNWDKEQYLTNEHNIVLDIKRTAEKNLIFYNRQIEKAMKSESLLVFGNTVQEAKNKLNNQLEYYRLTLYIYSFGSFMETILLNNYDEEYLMEIKSGIKGYLENFNQIYQNAFNYIEKMSNRTVEANIIESIGKTGKALGEFVNSIPQIKAEQAGDWLINSGNKIQETGQNIKKAPMNDIESISKTGIELFLDKFDDINVIYNHTKDIYLDKDNIYLLSDN